MPWQDQCQSCAAPLPWYCDKEKVFALLRCEPDLQDKNDAELLALWEAHPMLPCEVGIEVALRRMMGNR